MCGIVGFIGTGDRGNLIEMTRALAHRGPDDEGFYEHQAVHVFLGHRRLAIIDLDGGHQPMPNEDESVLVVFNGEIYNHLELRRELIARGHVFRTDHSDTEVLIHGYEEWGEDLPARLNGMFAFAIYDKLRGRVFLARDRFGEKPLYYTAQPRFFAFASELSAILKHPRSSSSLNMRSVRKFFAHGYIPGPNALYEHCAKLKGGWHLTYDIANDAVTQKRYWQFDIRPDESLTEADDERLAEELRALLIEAVRRRMMTDVPLGIFLSGGIDSGAVLAAATHLLGRDVVSTFTVGFTEPSFDESEQAQALARALGSKHSAETLDLDRARYLITALLRNMDEPLGDASLLPTHLLSVFTRKSVTVALSGDGGDELFAGYDPFKALGPASIYDRFMPKKVHQGLRHIARLMPISAANMSLDFKVRRTLIGLSYPTSLWNPIWLAPLEPGDIEELFSQPVTTEELYEEVLTSWCSDGRKSLVDRTLEFYTNFYLQDNILMKVDRAAMMASLETRAVFLDNDVVDFCCRLPHRFKYRRGERKYLLRRALKGMLPAEVLERRKKGFGVPIAKWLRTFAAEPPVSLVKGTSEEWVARRWAEHGSGKADHRLFLWSWLSLQSILNGNSASAATTAIPAV